MTAVPRPLFQGALALLAAVAASVPGAAQDEERWIEALFYPRVGGDRIEFNVTADDLDGATLASPDERVSRLEERIDAGDDGVEVELALVRALFSADEGDEARELLQDLWTRQKAEVERDPEDFEEVAGLGIIAFALGTHFRDRDALNTSLQLLTAARRQDDDLWLARAGLAQVFLFQGVLLLRAEDEEQGREALERARRMAEEAVEVDADRMNGHALVFLTSLMSTEVDTARELGEHVVRLADELADAAELAQEPAVTLAIACTYKALGLSGACIDAVDTLEAFEELTDSDDELGAAARDAADLVEGIAGLEGHEALWPTASVLRWWLAHHAGLDEAGGYLQAAVEAAGDSVTLQQAAVGAAMLAEDWEVAEELAEELLEEPVHERSRYAVARFEAARGETERAVELFEEAWEEDELVAAKAALAITLLKAGRDPEHDLGRALELLGEALDEDDELVAARFALGVARALEGDEDGAIEDLEEALELAEGDPSRTARIESVLDDLTDGE